LLLKKHPNHLRATEKTIQDSEEVWRYVKENALTVNLEKLNEKSAEFGIQDQTNRKFTKQIISFREKKKELLLDGKEIPPDMDQPIPQDLVDLESKDKTRVLSPFLKLKGLFF
jgi:DNA-binding PadR family transcriptional regulator